ncbi:Zinc finger HIT domain-containing protein 3 [Coemansia aciculifera]|uniref:Zinc finger HIT domain-containing protein 3 n=1 Tax=Coemansia aciculifera TaxID=417176 RepID=A0A9W8M2S3_9FUNG|nr:Zinc finger HIT domain-containing protein 3 [Coemansia aciculifera]KAJ2870911.1 Zinc finger HIT domain-containing protein 3 [Coemansia aciculifera]
MGGETCTVCSEAVSKYKCPTCRAGYCSVKCFKLHKLEPCAPLDHSTPAAAPNKDRILKQSEQERIGGDDEEEEKHRLTPSDLQKLDESAQVKQLLMNPNTRALLEVVRKDPNPVEAIRALRQRPDFEELAQALIGATDYNG